ncbi:MAG: helix-turn-helix transcriptional regulator [bacterium]|nr:helix-turn-helix transcriptional regulator [bacterium]
MPFPRQKPAAFLAKKNCFPDGDLRENAPPEVYLAAGVANRLKTKIGKESIRYIAKQAGLSPQTIINILNGTTWPDLRTIAKLENALNTRLWGYEHRKIRN